MNHARFSVSILVFLMFSACNGEAMDNYTQSGITIDRIEKVPPGSVKIYFRAMLETLYYCPGANVADGNDGVEVEFVRCSIKDQCATTHPVQKDGDVEFILIKNDSKPVYHKWESDRALVFPKSGG